MPTDPPPDEDLRRLELQNQRLKLENDRDEIRLPIKLADLGLRGTLTGAIAGAVLLVVLACISAFSDQSQITGNHLCVIAGIVCATVVFYGAFVFQRSLEIAVNRSKGVTAGTGGREHGKEKGGEPGARA